VPKLGKLRAANPAEWGSCALITRMPAKGGRHGQLEGRTAENPAAPRGPRPRDHAARLDGQGRQPQALQTRGARGIPWSTPQRRGPGPNLEALSQAMAKGARGLERLSKEALPDRRRALDVHPGLELPHEHFFEVLSGALALPCLV